MTSTKKDTEIRYQFECGCTMKKSDTKRIHKMPMPDGSKYNGLICPEHRAITTKRIPRCRDCGIDITIENDDMRGMYPHRCDKHKKTRINKIQNKYYFKVKRDRVTNNLMRSERIVYYFCECGCVKPREEMKYVRNARMDDGELYSGLHCIEHFRSGRQIQRITYCVHCAEKLENVSSGSCKFICDECLIRPRPKKRISAPYKKKVIKKNKDALYHKERGDHCMSSSTCDGYPMCKECDKFYPIMRGVDPGKLGTWTV